MALHGSVCANLSPILFKGNNRALGVNILIHQDESGSMTDVSTFYSNGTFIGELQEALINEKIGDDLIRYPNLYAYFGRYTRNSSSSFTISNENGSLIINQAFMRGEVDSATTISKWTGNNYFSNQSQHIVNICTDTIDGSRGRLFSGVPDTEDVHGNLWSIWTSPNPISTGTPGRLGNVLSSNVRKGSTTIVITNSDEQGGAPGDMINQLVAVNSTGTQQRTINGSTGELITRGYRVIALSSYDSTDGYDGVLFYGSSSTQPYGYVNFTGIGTFSIDRSSIAPNWTRSGNQIHNTLTLASETRGGLFKIRDVFIDRTRTDNRIAFSRCIAKFIADTV